MSATVKATSDVDVPASAAARGAERVIAKALADNAFVALWIFVSALVILFNKYILTVYGFPFPVTLTMTHCMCRTSTRTRPQTSAARWRVRPSSWAE